ncbi:MAG: membrane protease subunit, stomatin/prohibitin [Gemmatimonadaceae bacterium 4484_173]|nr:MAG: membrane protease subunit, stomatin/prohibitin [Gemmatimonadaceae bacterium 4484_173]
MLGIRFVKVEPTDFVIQYRRGKVVREGTGLSFFFFAPSTSLVRIPMGSTDVPFIFKEVTADFQEVSVQGQLTYRVADPKKLSELMNFTVSAAGDEYSSEDPEKLPQRLINLTQVLTRATLKSLPLRDALGQSGDLVDSIQRGMQTAGTVESLGIEVLGVSILAIKPVPETSRALEAEAREMILRQADEAIYARRNAAVEQERSIKENELNTEIAVENKKRQIKEAQMEAKKSVQRMEREISEAEMEARISLEQKNADLVELSTANSRKEADSRAYAVAAVMKALSNTNPRILQALMSADMKSGQLVAMAFRDLAESADKIGQLNVTPDLLRELLNSDKS